LSNPAAAAAHLTSAGVAAAKVQKLVDCGMIKVSFEDVLTKR